MKKILLLLLLLPSILLGAAQAQQPRPNKKMVKEIHEFKLKYLAQEMELTDEQKKPFVELYNKMSEEKYNNFKSACALQDKIDSGSATDAEYEAYSEALTQCKANDAVIEKKYDAQFAKFLTPKQMVKMKTSEEKFRKKMREMKHKNQHKEKNKKAKDR